MHRDDESVSAGPRSSWGRGPRTGAARQHTLREQNLALVSRAVFDSPDPPSRADIAAASGLARATVSVLVDQLVEARLVRELTPPTPQRAGRPAVPLAPARRTVVGLGLEVNVDYLGGRVLDLTGDVVAEHVVAGDFHRSEPDAVLGRLGAIARDLLHALEDDGMRVAGARLAIPGLIDSQAGLLRVAPNLGWSGLEPAPLLRLPASLPVEIANEADLAGLAQVDATAVPASFLYISGDVGIGSAIVIDHELFLGGRGWSGEIGHVVVDPDGPRCPCGATGCLEQYAGKDALLRAAGIAPGAPLETFLAALDGGDPRARAAADRGATALGSALADFINLVGLDTVLLGGIYTDLLPHLRAGLLAELDTRVLAAPWTAFDLRAAAVGDHAAMTGGAHAVLRDVVRSPHLWAGEAQRVARESERLGP